MTNWGIRNILASLVNPPFSLVIGHLSFLADVLTEQAMMRYIDLGERWKKSMRNDEWPAKNDKWKVGLLGSPSSIFDPQSSIFSRPTASQFQHLHQFAH